jgi:hypothetical protein
MKPSIPRKSLCHFACAAIFWLSAIGPWPCAAAPADPKPTALQVQFLAPGGLKSGETITLRGADDRRQLLVTATLGDGAERDVTHAASYRVSPSSIAKVDETGSLTPLRDGRATVTVKSPDGLSAKIEVAVEDFATESPVNFPNQIVPIFTKLGCNSGGCHGKSGGQNNFRLSLLGFEPPEDYEWLVKEARGRRIFTAAPEQSLLLLKGTATVPHGGGKKLEPGSDDYRLLVRWIRQGMPYGKPDDPTVTGIEVFPKQRVLPRGASQQLVVAAHYSDGSVVDVTRGALFEPNDKELAKNDEAGRVEFFKQPGDVAVMVRYQSQVAVFRATLPLGAPVANLPEPRNFIDELVFHKLKAVGMPASSLADDETFIRRVTIDIAGRLPTKEETEQFLAECGPAEHPSPALRAPSPLVGRGERDGVRGAAPDTATAAADNSSLSQRERAGVRGKEPSVVQLSPRQQEARDRLIDRLLAGDDYADYFANKWNALLRNRRDNPTHQHGTYAFHAWLRDSLHQNRPYDQIVRDVVAASGEVTRNPAVMWYRQVRNANTQIEDVGQMFLGMRLQCAQCHHHPFEKWSQQDYYSFSAFFAQVGRKAGERPGEEIIFHRRGTAQAKNPKTGQTVKPAGLGTEPFDIAPEDDPRLALADWMARRDNPFFAKSLVNRYWKHFLGRGLVEPEDDLRETNPATNPELLNALAEHFVSTGYDLKALVRTIVQSRTYQLSAEPNEHNQLDKQYFSRYYPKRLTAEVLLDGINEVTRTENTFDGLERGTRAVALPDNSFNASSYFLTVFGRPDSSSACECERSQDASLAQSLHLLNSKFVQDKLTADAGRAAALAADTTLTSEQKLVSLYTRFFSRPPNDAEVKLALAHLGKTVKDKDGKDVPIDPRQAWEDILWALINTKEFLFNH